MRRTGCWFAVMVMAWSVWAFLISWGLLDDPVLGIIVVMIATFIALGVFLPIRK